MYHLEKYREPSQIQQLPMCPIKKVELISTVDNNNFSILEKAWTLDSRLDLIKKETKTTKHYCRYVLLHSLIPGNGLH